MMVRTPMTTPLPQLILLPGLLNDAELWRDQITPAEGHRKMAAAIGCSHLVVIPDTGHMTPMEAPGPVNGALRHWLARPAGHR